MKLLEMKRIVILMVEISKSSYLLTKAIYIRLEGVNELAMSNCF